MFACNLFGIDRQVYYRRIKRKTIKEAKAIEVVSMVLEIRKSIPRLGTKKSYHILLDKFQLMNIGRDKTQTELSYNYKLSSSI
jgi:putative transposase